LIAAHVSNIWHLQALIRSRSENTRGRTLAKP
jgi:hypothetical protein